ncbi:MAG: antibiotic biosynthesis monooxygenase [Rhodospirillaceae bacterium]|nr:antibiotic biosynthesis monooxygenase [Rhodospirillaceae bacterium]
MANGTQTGVILAVRVHVDPAVRDRFMPLMLANRDGARTAEPGCLRYDVFQDFDDPDNLLVIEEYADRAALAAHRESPHYLAWAAFAASLPDGTITRARWTGVEPFPG